MVTMPSTEASARSSTTHPTANTISPLTRVNTARPFSSGCDWPSLFNDRGERGRVLAASGISATLLRSRSVEEDCSRVEGNCSPHGTARNHLPAAGRLSLCIPPARAWPLLMQFLLSRRDRDRQSRGGSSVYASLRNDDHPRPRSRGNHRPAVP